MSNSIPNITLNNGTKIPQIGFGVFQIPNEKTEAAVSTALEAGYRSIDTAAIYGNEIATGKAIAAAAIPREQLFVTTKLWNSEQGAEKTLPAFESSLEKLKLDYIDLFLIHWPIPAKDLYLQTWEVLENLLATKMVKAIGVSNFLPEHLDRILKLGATVPAVNQIELHPALQQKDTVAYNKTHGIVTQAWSPLAQGGMLTHPVIVDVAQQLQRSSAQVILRWHLQQGRVVIPKSVTESRIYENLNVFDFSLNSQQLASFAALENDGRIGPHPANFNG